MKIFYLSLLDFLNLRTKVPYIDLDFQKNVKLFQILKPYYKMNRVKFTDILDVIFIILFLYWIPSDYAKGSYGWIAVDLICISLNIISLITKKREEPETPLNDKFKKFDDLV